MSHPKFLFLQHHQIYFSDFLPSRLCLPNGQIQIRQTEVEWIVSAISHLMHCHRRQSSDRLQTTRTGPETLQLLQQALSLAAQALVLQLQLPRRPTDWFCLVRQPLKFKSGKETEISSQQLPSPACATVELRSCAQTRASHPGFDASLMLQ